MHDWWQGVPEMMCTPLKSNNLKSRPIPERDKSTRSQLQVYSHSWIHLNHKQQNIILVSNYCCLPVHSWKCANGIEHLWSRILHCLIKVPVFGTLISKSLVQPLLSLACIQAIQKHTLEFDSLPTNCNVYYVTT